MYLDKEKIKKILKKHEKDFKELEHYDKTREKLWAKGRLDVLLTNRLIVKLKEIKEKTGKPVSHIIEEAVSGI